MFGIFLQFYAGKWSCAGGAVLVTLIWLLCWAGVGRRRVAVSSAAVLLLISFCCGSLFMQMEMGRRFPYLESQSVAQSERGEQSVIRGEVESIQVKSRSKGNEQSGQDGQNGYAGSGGADYYRVTLRTGFREKILLTVIDPPDSLGVASAADLVGREVQAVGHVLLPAARRNPGSFDYRLYLRTKDIFAVMETDRGGFSVYEGVRSPIMHGLALARETFAERIRTGSDETVGGLILGMLFGDKSAMEDDMYEEFQKNGVAHLLAVSGIHVNVIYLYIRKLLRGRRDILSSLAVLFFLLVYAALSGFSPSVMRSSLMITFSVAAILFRRNYDMCTGIGAAALLLLAIQPYRLFDLGFQLSFLAAASLAVVLPWANMKASRFADQTKRQWVLRLAEQICPMLVIQGVMAIITAYCFQYFSWSSFLLNPLLIPLAGLIVPLGILLFPLSFLPGKVGELLFAMGLNGAGIPAQLMIFGSRFFAERDWGSVSVVSPPMGIVILFYAGLFFFCSESCYILRRRGKKPAVVAVSVAILLFASVFPFAVGAADLPLPFSRKTYPMVFVDVGQGDCLHIRTPGGKNILIDGGGSMNYNIGKKTLAPYLLKNGVSRIDVALVTHLHADHYRGIQELAAVIPVEKIGMYEGNQLRQKEIEAEWRELGIGEEEKPEILYLKKGDRIQLEEDVWVEILGPEKRTAKEYREILADEADENASSLVMAVYYKGLRTLMTGDMGFDGEDALLKGYGLLEGNAAGPLSAHILKTGHHGSKYSTSEQFLNAVNPNTAVIQVGKNNFGHPSARVIELFRNYGIIIYRTDLHGAILIQSIAQRKAVLSDVRKENIWHISL